MALIDFSMPSEMHPIALDAFGAYMDGAQKIDDRTLEDLGGRLLGISANLQELWGAVSSIGAVALTLEAQGDTTAADRLRGLIQRQASHFRPVMEELAQTSGEARQRAASAFSQMFGGKEEVKSAPKHGEKAPEGSVSLKSFLPNPALEGRPRPKTSSEASGTPVPPRSSSSASPRRRISVDGPKPAAPPRRGRIAEAPPAPPPSQVAPPEAAPEPAPSPPPKPAARPPARPAPRAPSAAGASPSRARPAPGAVRPVTPNEGEPPSPGRSPARPRPAPRGGRRRRFDVDPGKTD